MIQTLASETPAGALLVVLQTSSAAESRRILDSAAGLVRTPAGAPRGTFGLAAESEVEWAPLVAKRDGTVARAERLSGRARLEIVATAPRDREALTAWIDAEKAAQSYEAGSL